MKKVHWFKNMVIYEVFLKSFQDSNGDGLGDIQGLISRLDYVQGLGVDAIYMMPLFTSARNVDHERARLLGYEVKDPLSVDPEYGTEEDVRQLTSEAHKRGIRIILDYVTLGVSKEHAYFQDLWKNPETSRYRDFFFIRDYDPTDENWCHYREFDAWNRLPNGEYYYCLWGDIPFINYSNPEVERYMFSVAEYWMDMGIDGFRLDATKFIIANGPGVELQEHQPETVDYWKRFKKNMLKKYGDDMVLLAEILPANTPVDYFGKDREIMDYLYDGTFAEEIYGTSGVACSEITSHYLESLIRKDYYEKKLIYHSNHDLGRIATKIHDRTDKNLRLTAALLLLSPGAPMIYFGEELGLLGIKENDFYETLGTLSSMAWDDSHYGGFTDADVSTVPLSSDYREHNVAKQDSDPGSLLNLYRELIAFRKRYSLFGDGEIFKLLLDDEKVYYHILHNEEGALLIIHNYGSNARSTRINLGNYGIQAEVEKVLETIPIEYQYGDNILSVTGCPPLSSTVFELKGITSGDLVKGALDFKNSSTLPGRTPAVINDRQLFTVPERGLAIHISDIKGYVEVEFYDDEENLVYTLKEETTDSFILPLTVNTKFVSITACSVSAERFDWSTCIDNKTSILDQHKGNQSLCSLAYGHDEHFHYITIEKERFVMLQNSGFDTAIFFHDPGSEGGTDTLHFWLLPELMFSKKISALISYQHNINPPAIFTNITKTLQPGTKRARHTIYEVTDSAIYFMFSRTVLPLTRYQVAAAVWSAGGNWGDIIPDRFPLVEILPHNETEMEKKNPCSVSDFITIE
jgi:alpha-amylase